MHQLKLPRVGMRTVKTVISATLVAMIYSLTGRNACFACIGAVYGLGNMFKEGLRSGGNRFIGTLIGGLLSLPFYPLYHSAQFSWFPAWLYLAIGLFLLVYICQTFHVNGGIQPGSVVFFVVIYTVTEEMHLSYVIARIIDTGVGVLFSLLINWLWPAPLDKASRAVQLEQLHEDEREIEELSQEVRHINENLLHTK